MNKYLLITIILLILLIVLIKLKNILNTKNNNNFEFYYLDISGLSEAQKAAILIKKIEEGVEYYNKVKQYLPKLKEIYEKITDWNILKPKLCNWASQNKLLPSLVYLIDKVMEKYPIMSDKVKNSLTKFKTILLKLMSYMSIAIALKLIMKLVKVPDDISSKILIFTNIDKNILNILNQIGIDVCSNQTQDSSSIDQSIKEAAIPAPSPGSSFPEPPPLSTSKYQSKDDDGTS